MAVILEELEHQALQLPPKERSELIHRLIVILEDEPKESSEVITEAWSAEIARRVVDMEAGRTKWIAADEVRRIFVQKPMPPKLVWDPLVHCTE